RFLHHVDIQIGGALSPHGRTTFFPVSELLFRFGSFNRRRLRRGCRFRLPPLPLQCFWCSDLVSRHRNSCLFSGGDCWCFRSCGLFCGGSEFGWFRL
ncbi:hypothetical protein A2U01_0069286, partial [Trifolium medium]|nr:hypothetical protein [Trifolium medium]